MTPELQQYCSRKVLGVGFDADYKYCMKNDLPAANVATFHSEGNSGIDWKNYQIEYEEPPITITSYASGCYGDSGSGQFITNGLDPEKDDKFRFILAAIFTKRVGDIFKDDQGVEHKVPCGAYTFDKDASIIGARKYLQSYSISESITTPAYTFWWIKGMAEI